MELTAQILTTEQTMSKIDFRKPRRKKVKEKESISGWGIILICQIAVSDGLDKSNAATNNEDHHKVISSKMQRLSEI